MTSPSTTVHDSHAAGRSRLYRVLKRAADVCLALVLTVVLSPVLVLIALLVKASSPGAVLFRQRRIGRHRREFMMLKFRTMREDAPHDTPTHLLSNPMAHVTPLGSILRRTSLDELPQVWNVLRGDMSFVGPRPALWNQYDLINERDTYGANDVRPGLTGWAQVNGRDELPVDEKARLDGYYVERMGVAFDIRCILRTLSAVLTARGVAEGWTGEGSDE